MIRFTCPHCEKALRAEEAKAGSVVKCPACGQKLAIPPLEPEPAPLEVIEPEETEQEQPEPRKKRRRKVRRETTYAEDPTEEEESINVGQLLLFGVGGLVFLTGVGLFIGNITGLLRTFPFAGYLTMALGGFIMAGGKLRE